jgi:hypothetical protein
VTGPLLPTHFKNTFSAKVLCDPVKPVRFTSSNVVLVTCPECLWRLKKKPEKKR